MLFSQKDVTTALTNKLLRHAQADAAIILPKAEEPKEPEGTPIAELERRLNLIKP